MNFKKILLTVPLVLLSFISVYAQESIKNELDITKLKGKVKILTVKETSSEKEKNGGNTTRVVSYKLDGSITSDKEYWDGVIHSSITNTYDSHGKLLKLIKEGERDGNNEEYMNVLVRTYSKDYLYMNSIEYEIYKKTMKIKYKYNSLAKLSSIDIFNTSGIFIYRIIFKYESSGALIDVNGYDSDGRSIDDSEEYNSFRLNYTRNNVGNIDSIEYSIQNQYENIEVKFNGEGEIVYRTRYIPSLDQYSSDQSVNEVFEVIKDSKGKIVKKIGHFEGCGNTLISSEIENIFNDGQLIESNEIQYRFHELPYYTIITDYNRNGFPERQEKRQNGSSDDNETIYSLTTYNYDDNGRIVSKVENNTIEHTYYDTKQIIYEKEWKDNTIKVESYEKTITDYDEEDKKIKTTYYQNIKDIFNGTSSTNTHSTIYVYNKGFLSEQLEYNTNNQQDSNKEIIPEKKYLYSYDSKGNLTLTKEYWSIQRFGENQLELVSQITRNYDMMHNLIRIERYNGNKWEYAINYEYVYY